jgi:NTE family protein
MQIFDGLTLSALLDPFTRGSETKDADVLFSVMPRGLVKGDLIERWFSQLVRGATFESIDKSVAVVAADLAAARQIVFGKTPSAPTRLKIMSNVPVASALRASVSLPGVFAPFLLGETLLVDGGVVNNLPTDVARELGANYVIGVDIGRPRSPVTGIRTFVDVILEAFSVMGQTVDRCHAQNERNFRGFIIHPTVTRKYGWNRGAMAELYGIGRRAALEALPAIKKDLRLAP